LDSPLRQSPLQGRNTAVIFEDPSRGSSGTTTERPGDSVESSFSLFSGLQEKKKNQNFLTVVEDGNQLRLFVFIALCKEKQITTVIL
jgi:hypothetical protein